MTRLALAILLASLSASTAWAAPPEYGLLSAFEAFCITSRPSDRIEMLEVAGAQKVEERIARLYLSPQTGSVYTISVEKEAYMVGILDNGVCNIFQKDSDGKVFENLLLQRFKSKKVHEDKEGGDNVDYVAFTTLAGAKSIAVIRKPAFGEGGGVSVSSIPASNFEGLLPLSEWP